MDDFIRVCVRALEKLYQAGRITESKGSADAVKRLRRDSDTVEAFLASEVRVTGDNKEKARRSSVFAEYVEYCREMERQPLSKQNFFRSMSTKGWNAVLTDGYYCYRGMMLKSEDPKEWPVLPSREDPYSGRKAEEHRRAV